MDIMNRKVQGEMNCVAPQLLYLNRVLFYVIKLMRN